MSTAEILRAWRDHDYWLSLTERQRSRVPENPAGVVELMDVELTHVSGMTHTFTHCSESCTCTDSCFGTCDQTFDPPSSPVCCC